MEYRVKRLLGILYLALFLLSCYLVLSGQRSIGYAGVGTMMLGLIGILLSLWGYNIRNR